MSKSISGARVVFKINSTKVLYADSLSYTITHGHDAIAVLDQLEPVEFAEKEYRVQFACTMFRTPNLSTMDQGLIPKMENFLAQPELTAELIDKVTNDTIMLIERVKCVEESFNIGAREVGKLTLNFVGIKRS